MSSQVLKVGLIGAGAVSLHHLRAYQCFPDQLRLVAICDFDESAARERAYMVGVQDIYNDPLRMLEEAAIDAVDICTPHDSHAWLSIAAAEAEKHILVEKPMACSMQECRAMVHAAEQAGVILMVAQNQRYNAVYRGVGRLIQSGSLGKLHAARLDSMQNLATFLPRQHWLYDGKRAGGGIIISVAVHRIDLLRYFIGEISRVAAICRTMRPEFFNGAEDYASVIFEFENGAVGEMFATYSGFRIPWSESFMIFGSDGTIHAVPPLGMPMGPAFIATKKSCNEIHDWNDQFCGFNPVEPEHKGLIANDSYIDELLHFRECCLEGKEPITSGRDNLGTMRAIFGIYESARTGQTVELEMI